MHQKRTEQRDWKRTPLNPSPVNRKELSVAFLSICPEENVYTASSFVYSGFLTEITTQTKRNNIIIKVAKKTTEKYISIQVYVFSSFKRIQDIVQ